MSSLHDELGSAVTCTNLVPVLVGWPEHTRCSAINICKSTDTFKLRINRSLNRKQSLEESHLAGGHLSLTGLVGEPLLLQLVVASLACLLALTVQRFRETNKRVMQ